MLVGAEATGAVGIAAEDVDVAPLAGNVGVRVELPPFEDVNGFPTDAVAAADGTPGFDTDDDGRRGVREPGVELEADDRVAEELEEAEESVPEVSAAATPAVRMAAAVPIPSNTASAPTRPTCMAFGCLAGFDSAADSARSRLETSDPISGLPTRRRLAAGSARVAIVEQKSLEGASSDLDLEIHISRRPIDARVLARQKGRKALGKLHLVAPSSASCRRQE